MPLLRPGMEGFRMTSPLLRLLAERITEERHERRADGRDVESVSVAPLVADALSEEFEEGSRINEPPEVTRRGMAIHGVAVEPDDDLSAMEFEP